MNIYLRKFLVLLVFFIFSSFPLCSLKDHLTVKPAFGKDKKIEIIEVEIIKEKGEEEKPKVIYDPLKIEKVRKITKGRILCLAVFWLIILSIFIMIRIQLKNEKRLLDEGYYETELNY